MSNSINWQVCILHYPGNEDIANGNVKLILGLVWRLILHYQISSSGSASGKQLLSLVAQKTLSRDMDIRNLTTDWNDGLALKRSQWVLRNRGCVLTTKASIPMQGSRTRAKPWTLPRKTLKSQRCFLRNSSWVLTSTSWVWWHIYRITHNRGSIGEKRTLEFINEAAPELNVKNFNTDWKRWENVVPLPWGAVPWDYPGFWEYR